MRSTYLVSNLSRDGWVERIPSAVDRRGYDACLTTQGIETVLAATELHQQTVSEYLLDGMTEADIDSTETVDVKATYPQMATDYTVKGSYENEKIKELALKQINLQARCQSILAERPDLADSIITVLMNDYKQDVSRNYIFKEPMRAYSYFALFQYIVIGNQAHLIFDPSRGKVPR